MKKVGFLFFVSLLIISLFIINLVSSQLESIEKQVEDAQAGIDKAQEIADSPWDYLRTEWEKLLLKNNFIAGADKFFKSISIVFRVLFGMNYSMSLLLFGSVILWFVLFIVSSKIITSTQIATPGASFILGALFVIVIAQTGALQSIVTFTGKFIFSRENSWVKLGLLVLVFVLLFVFYFLGDFLSKYIQQTKEAAKKRATDVSQKAITKFTEKFSKASSAE